MRIISYIAMIATAAFCQLSSCTNQADAHVVNGNQSQPAVRTFDTWTVKIPVDFSVKFVRTNNLVVDFDTKKARVPWMPSIQVSCAGPEVMGSTSLSIDHRRFTPITSQPGNPHALLEHSVDMCPLHFSGEFVQTGNRVVEVDFRTKKARVPLGENIQFSVAGSEWNTSLSIVHNCLPTRTIPAVASFQLPLMETRPTIEMKEENAQEKMDSQAERKIDSENSKILENKKDESKPPKKPDYLKKSSNDHIEEDDKKEAKKIDKIDRKYFLNKYSKDSLDNEAKEQIKVLFDSGITSPAEILDELLTPSNAKKREKEFSQIANKVFYYIKKLKAEQKGTD